MADLSQAEGRDSERQRGPDLVRPRYRADIDGLRAVAVLSVVGFHAFPSWVSGGFVGVDVFFVISGFLISSIIFGTLEDGGFRFAAFYVRRIKRIFPALAVVLVAGYVFGWFALLPGEFEQLGKHSAAAAAFVSNFALWQESGYFDAAAETKPLLHLWSLGIEEQFYIIWPLLAFLAWRLRLSLLTVTLVLGVISFVLNVVYMNTDIVGTFYSPVTRFWELLLGCALAYTARHARAGARRATGFGVSSLTPKRMGYALQMPTATVNHLKSVCGLALIAVSVLVLDKGAAFPGWWALLPTIGTYLLISAGPDAWINRKVLSRAVLVWFGLISYPLYLWHWPLLSFARMGGTRGASVETRSLLILVSIVLAWLTYRFVERPVRFGAPRRAIVPALCALMVVVGATGLGTFRGGGFDFRFPAEIRSLANYQYDFRSGARYGECWLYWISDADAFAPSCTAASGTGDHLVIWGDSHAAMLYPGLRSYFGDELAISQFAKDRCPPATGRGYATDYPKCIASNDHVISQISRLKPDSVLLFALWALYYDDEWSGGAHILQRLAETVTELKRVGITNVVVVGPAPVWAPYPTLEPDLPKLLYRYWKNDYPRRRIPERLPGGTYMNVATVDDQLRRLAMQTSVRYLSLLDLFCNDDGCLALVPGDSLELTTWDYSHLTVGGAALVAEELHRSGYLASGGFGEKGR